MQWLCAGAARSAVTALERRAIVERQATCSQRTGPAVQDKLVWHEGEACPRIIILLIQFNRMAVMACALSLSPLFPALVGSCKMRAALQLQLQRTASNAPAPAGTAHACQLGLFLTTSKNTFLLTTVSLSRKCCHLCKFLHDSSLCPSTCEGCCHSNILHFITCLQLSPLFLHVP